VRVIYHLDNSRFKPVRVWCRQIDEREPVIEFAGRRGSAAGHGLPFVFDHGAVGKFVDSLDSLVFINSRCFRDDLFAFIAHYYFGVLGDCFHNIYGADFYNIFGRRVTRPKKRNYRNSRKGESSADIRFRSKFGVGSRVFQTGERDREKIKCDRRNIERNCRNIKRDRRNIKRDRRNIKRDRKDSDRDGRGAELRF